MLEKYSQNDLILLCLFSYAGYKSSNVAEQAKRISLQSPTFSEGRYAKKITDFIVNRENTIEAFSEFYTNLLMYNTLFSCIVTGMAPDGPSETRHVYTNDNKTRNEVLDAIIYFCKSNSIFWKYPKNTSQADATALKLITRFKQEQLFV